MELLLPMCVRPIRYGLGILTHPWGEHVTWPSKSVCSIPLAVITHSSFLAQTDPNPLGLIEELMKQRSLFPQNLVVRRKQSAVQRMKPAREGSRDESLTRVLIFQELLGLAMAEAVAETFCYKS